MRGSSMKTFLCQVGTKSLRRGLACFCILFTVAVTFLGTASISLAAPRPNGSPPPNKAALIVKVVTTGTTSTGASKSFAYPLISLPPSTTPQQLQDGQDKILEDRLSKYPQFRWK